ncbi:MAG: methyl-accepting chemotaxis protein [Roseateles depolymerans]|uniref:Methyl-accepting chemotaxis protein n=1 Tax=Roseateles depolymerans TaxID=76731 RepID=A0A2W5DU53_9BURK|nr:MAG: methyl-accepting chemotaxis protein [Roseateles depolymerans]
MNNLRVGIRLALAFAVLLVLMLAMAAIGVFQAKAINYYAEYYPENILPSLRAIREIDGFLSDGRRLETQHLLVEDAQERRSLEDRIAQVREAASKRLKDYEALVSDDDDRGLMTTTGQQVKAYFGAQDEVLAASRQGLADPAQATKARNLSMGQARQVFTEARGTIEKWWKYNEGVAAAATASAAAAYQRVLTVFAAVAVVALALGIWAAWLITRSITGPVQKAVEAVRSVAGGDLTLRVHANSRDELGQLLNSLDEMTRNLSGMVAGVRSGCDQINVAATEIAQGNSDLSARTETQASSLEQTAASVEQMAAQIKANADNARQADQLASHASEVAQAGGAAVGEVVRTMDDISQSSRKIADIIGVIDGIAFQTNILALNAAVEAARAGDQGRGFAVVAGEVRSLASRSAEAAKEIKSLIGDSVAKVENGSTQVLQARETIEQMVTEMRRVTDLVAEITVSSREQSDGVVQINVAVSQLDQATQQNAALVEQTAAAAESMRQQSTRLSEAVAAFRVDGSAPRLAAAGGASLSPASPPRAAPSPAARAGAAAPKPARPPLAARAAKPAVAARPASAPQAAPAPKPAARAAAVVEDKEGDWETF